jgi:hypothetical protein
VLEDRSNVLWKLGPHVRLTARLFIPPTSSGVLCKFMKTSSSPHVPIRKGGPG